MASSPQYPRQPSFASGELAPSLYGRTDLPRQALGARRVRDFVVGPAGDLLSRPGTAHVGIPGSGSFRRYRLVPFVVSDVLSYVLLVTHDEGVPGSGRIIVYSQGAFVATVFDSTHEGLDLSLLSWTQAGDVLTLMHPEVAPLEVTRTAHASWSVAAVDFTPRPFLVQSVGPELLSPLPTAAPPAQPEREWVWKVTMVAQEEDGTQWESTPHTCTFESVLSPRSYVALPDNLVAVYPDKPVTLFWDPLGATTPPGYRILGWNVYRGRGGLHGFVGFTRTTRFIDYGDAPDYTRTPPQGVNPFEVRTDTGAGGAVSSLVRTEVPRTATHFERRRVYGGTAERPATLFLSSTDDFYNHDRPLLPVATSALELELASRFREEVRALLPLDSLLVFTNASVWAVDGGGEPLAHDALSVRVQEEVGIAEGVPPLAVGSSAFYVRAKGKGVRALAYNEQGGGYRGMDLSLLASHLFEEESVVAMDWAEDPDSMVWAVRSDGTLLSLTWRPEAEVWAWALHTLGGDGLARDVCVVPEGEEDGVYLIVQRENLSGVVAGTPVFTLERLGRRPDGGPQSRLDAYVVPSSVDTVAGTLSLAAGASGFSGRTVWAVRTKEDGSQDAQGPLTPYESGGFVVVPYTFPSDYDPVGDTLHVGFLYTPTLETLDWAAAEAPGLRVVTKNVTRAFLEVDEVRGLEAGETEDTLKPVAGLSASLPSGAPLLAEVRLGSAWNKGGRVVVCQTQPLPVRLSGLWREVVLGGP